MRFDYQRFTVLVDKPLNFHSAPNYRVLGLRFSDYCHRRFRFAVCVESSHAYPVFPLCQLSLFRIVARVHSRTGLPVFESTIRQ